MKCLPKLKINTARLERAYLNDEGEIKIKEYCLKILLGERDYEC